MNKVYVGREKILAEIARKKGEPITSKQICENLNLSYPTITKWLLVLEAEGKVRVRDYGNIKFYYLQDKGVKNEKEK